MPNRQEVVKLDLVREGQPGHVIEQKVSRSVSPEKPSIAAELLVGGITLHLFNGADEQLIQNTLRLIGGMNHAW